MPVYIMATRLNGEEAYPALQLEHKEGKVMRAIRDAGLDVNWIGSYVTMGPYDYIDIFSAPDEKTALIVNTLVRRVGGAQTEIWTALEWKDFRNILTELPKAA